MAITTNATAITFSDATVQTTAYTASGGDIPAGSVMLFYQSGAPTGWTQVTTQNNKALRVVSGTGGVAGGTTAFSSVFTNQTVSTSISVSGTTGSTTLSTSQIPSHTHQLPFQFGGGNYCEAVPIAASGGGGINPYANTNASGGGGSHNHSFSGSGSGTSSAVTLNVQYIDIILASKN